MLSRTWIPVPTSDVKCSLVWQHASTPTQRDSINILGASNGAGWQLCGGCFYLLCQKPWLQSLVCLGGGETDFANVAGFLFCFCYHLENENSAQLEGLLRHEPQNDREETPGAGNAHCKSSVPMVRTAAASTGLQKLAAEALYLFLHGGVWRTHAGTGSILHVCKTHHTHTNHWKSRVWNLQNIGMQPFTCVSDSKIHCWNYILKLTNRHKINFILISSRDSKNVGIKGKFRGMRDQDFWKKRQAANTHLKSLFRQVKVRTEIEKTEFFGQSLIKVYRIINIYNIIFRNQCHLECTKQVQAVGKFS